MVLYHFNLIDIKEIIERLNNTNYKDMIVKNNNFYLEVDSEVDLAFLFNKNDDIGDGASSYDTSKTYLDQSNYDFGQSIMDLSVYDINSVEFTDISDSNMNIILNYLEKNFDKIKDWSQKYFNEQNMKWEDIKKLLLTKRESMYYCIKSNFLSDNIADCLRYSWVYAQEVANVDDAYEQCMNSLETIEKIDRSGDNILLLIKPSYYPIFDNDSSFNAYNLMDSYYSDPDEFPEVGEPEYVEVRVSYDGFYGAVDVNFFNDELNYRLENELNS